MDKRTTYQENWDSTHTKRYMLKLNLNTDKDIIEHIDESNKQGSLKKLIRDGIKYRQVNK